MSRSVMSVSGHDSTHPPPCPLAEVTKPAYRSPAIRRRTTTGLVCMACAIASDVAGPSISAMCSSAWGTLESRLSRFMQHLKLRDASMQPETVLAHEQKATELIAASA